MDRRTVLKIATSGAAFPFLPSWLVRGFFQRGSGEPPGDGPGVRRLVGPLDVHWHHARKRGKPLLLLLVPRRPDERADRGLLFGGLLNHGTDEAMADLALCEVVCASADAVRSQFKDARFEGEPLMVLVEQRREGVGVVPVDATLPRGDGSGLLREGREVRWIDRGENGALECIAMVAEALHGAVAPDRRTLAARAEGARSVLSEEQQMALAAMAEEGAKLDLALADRGAAVLLRIAEETPALRPRVLGILRQTVAERFRTAAPSGARWARYYTCIPEFEGEEGTSMVDCGMALVPEVSRRFLRFLTEE
ncbi:MAG TPA: hypothetical protein VFI25_18820 [Planctomycetota bacterium]|nr:hypothetical protein [Planctomycetota bacterium]